MNGSVCETPGCPLEGVENPLLLVLAHREVVLCGSCGQARTLIGKPECVERVAPPMYQITTMDTIPPFPDPTFVGTDTLLPPHIPVWDGLTGGVTESGIVIATELSRSAP